MSGVGFHTLSGHMKDSRKTPHHTHTHTHLWSTSSSWDTTNTMSRWDCKSVYIYIWKKSKIIAYHWKKKKRLNYFFFFIRKGTRSSYLSHDWLLIVWASWCWVVVWGLVFRVYKFSIFNYDDYHHHHWIYNLCLHNTKFFSLLTTLCILFNQRELHIEYQHSSIHKGTHVIYISLYTIHEIHIQTVILKMLLFWLVLHLSRLTLYQIQLDVAVIFLPQHMIFVCIIITIPYHITCYNVKNSCSLPTRRDHASFHGSEKSSSRNILLYYCTLHVFIIILPISVYTTTLHSM